LGLLYSLVAAADNLKGLLAEATAAVKNRTEAVALLGFAEANLGFGPVLPKAEEDVKRAFSGVENVSAEGEVESARGDVFGAEFGVHLVAAAGHAVLRAVCLGGHPGGGVTGIPAEAKDGPLGPIHFGPGAYAGIVIFEHFLGRVGDGDRLVTWGVGGVIDPPAGGFDRSDVVAAVPGFGGADAKEGPEAASEHECSRTTDYGPLTTDWGST